jgi:prepilin-type N-terminal cleavage/methylation domain-containing protein
MSKKKRLNRKGFTLIELIVVIAILGILAAIAVPRLMGFRQTAQTAANRESANVIEKAAELYFASNDGKIAHDVEGLTKGAPLTGITEKDNWLKLLIGAGMIDAETSFDWIDTISIGPDGDATVTLVADKTDE